MNSIFKRTSVRRFEDKPVEPEKIELMLRAAMQAPSGGNQQPWEFYVVTNKEKLVELSKSSKYAACAAQAPLAIVPCMRNEHMCYAKLTPLDMSAATENLLLEACELDLGAVWLCVYPDEERSASVRATLDIPDNLDPFVLIACGYPKEKCQQESRYDKARVHFVK